MFYVFRYIEEKLVEAENLDEAYEKVENGIFVDWCSESEVDEDLITNPWE